MKVIDLLNKIANGEEVPNKFRFYYITYYLQDNKCFKYCYRNMENNELFEKHFVLEDLNREIEITEDTPNYIFKHYSYKEDKKIEKLKIYDDMINWCCNDRAINDTEKDIIDKLNEIIDKINGEDNE